LRFLRGDFRRADPQRGRFRDYVKTALIHLVNDYYRAQRERPGPLPADVSGPAAPADADAQFLASWGEELLNRTWAALAETNPTFHAVLLAHVQHPDLQSPQLAEQLTAQLGKPFTATHIRVTLHRAREKFADLLLEEVARSLETPTEAELEQELRDLRLLKLCTSALGRRQQRS
jgi:RNA polymerase sigma-70 factor (ECF subfamily)